MNKLGPYVGRLMTTVLDKEQEQFVKDLAWNELKTINASIEEFLRKNSKNELEEEEKTEKQLLQENKNVERYKFGELEKDELFWQTNSKTESNPWRKINQTQATNLKSQTVHNFQLSTIVYQKV